MNNKKTKTVIEIGPGEGALTKYLLLRKIKVIAYEIDPEKVKILKDKFKKEIESEQLIIKNLNVLEENFKNFETDTIFSNLPYGISEPFFYKTIRSKINHIYLVTGERFYTHLIGVDKLGIYRKTFYQIKLHEIVPKTAFDPQPRVNSTFFALHRKENNSFLEVFLSQSDKKLKNALIESICTHFELTKRESKDKLAQLNISEDILSKRIGHLSNNQFSLVINTINEKI